MATPNIVPREDSEGQLGTASKYWAAAYIDLIYLGAGKVGRDADNLFDFSTDNQIKIRVNGTNEIFMNSARFAPSTNDGYILGGASNQWSDLFLADGAVINFNDSNVTLTHSSNRLTLADSDELAFGTSSDFKIWHDGSNTYLSNEGVGHMNIQNTADDKDIILKSDDGSGGTTAYITLDGGLGYTTVQKAMKFLDNVSAAFGTGGNGDYGIVHDGTDTKHENFTGDLKFINYANDKDIILQSDDGSGGVTAYITLDGSAGTVEIAKDTNFAGKVGIGITPVSKLHVYENSTETTSAHGITVEQDGTGDAVVQYLLTGTRRWVTGIDNSDSDKFKFAYSSDLGSDEILSLNPNDDTAIFAGNLTIEGGLLHLGKADAASAHINSKELMTFNIDTDNDDTNRYFAWYVNGESGSGTELLKILETGAATFAGNVTVSGDITLSTDADILKAGTNPFRVFTNGTQALSISASQNATFAGTVAGTSFNGIPFFTDAANNSMYTHDVSGTDDTAQNNTAYGFAAMDAITTGDSNTAVGKDAGSAINTGADNTLLGTGAGDAITSGNFNVAVGRSALGTEGTGSANIAIGYQALTLQNTSSSAYNVAVGHQAGTNVTTGTTNTLIGGLAGDALTTGTSNVAIGYGSLSAEDGHGHNVAIGYHALVSQNAGANAYNVAVGSAAGTAITTGVQNTIVGGLAGDALTTGSFNVSLGYNSLSATTVGAKNTAIGNFALNENVRTNNNVAIGQQALQSLVGNGSTDNEETFNTAIGYFAGKEITSGILNTVVGGLAGDALTTGKRNVAIGYEALSTEDTGSRNVAIGEGSLTVLNYDGAGYNVAVGYDSGHAITTGINNTVLGANAGDALTTGSDNVALGYNALGSANGGESRNVAIGNSALLVMDFNGTNNNVAVGYEAGKAVSTGVNNTIIGTECGDALTTGDNNTIIGAAAAASAVGVDNEITLGNSSISAIRAQVTSISSLSDRRDKKDIEESVYGLDFLESLKPVTFEWDQRDGNRVGVKDVGFIAQDLQEVDDEYTRLVYESNPNKLEATYGRLIPVLVKAIQELSEKVKALENK